MAIDKIEHKPLHCPLCGNRFMNIYGQPLPNHSQLRCVTPTGDEMDLGICADCVEKGVSIDTCNAVLDGIKDFWVWEIDANNDLTTKEKVARKKQHKRHTIDAVNEVVNTGARAEKEARKKGKLR